MDHEQIIAKALDTLRRNIDEKLSSFNLLPETFTMKDVQELYETIYDKPFVRNNFQKKILEFNVLESLEKKFTGASALSKTMIEIIISNVISDKMI
jgi:hypothetical protein